MSQSPKKQKPIKNIIRKQQTPSKNQHPTQSIQQVIQSVQRQQDISIKQLHIQMKEFELQYKQSLKQIKRLRKEIQLRPTLHNLTQNTILITTSIHSDPNIIKLLHTRENQEYNNQVDDDGKDLYLQLKNASLKLGKKLSQINDGLPLILQMIKGIQKQLNTQISQIKSLVQQKTNSMQDQLNQLKIQQITQRLNLTQKLQSQCQVNSQKIRQLQTKNNYEIKEIKNKLHQKINKQIFDNTVANIIQQNKKIIKQFQQQSTTLVNPQKIKQIQNLIKTNKQNLMKQLVECHMNINNITNRIDKQLVNIEFYKKQRTTLQKRISTTINNFTQQNQKLSHLKTITQDFSIRIPKLQKQNNQKTKSMHQMKTVLKNLSITQQFQKMLSQIDPQKIMLLQTKILNLQMENKQVYRQFNHVSQQIDKIYSKFQVAGVLVPNKSRDKEFQLNDLTQIIDQYFSQNRFASKISKMQAELNQGKASVQAIKLLDKKISRLQKQSEYSHIVNQFKRLEQHMKKQIKIFQQKIQHNVSQAQINKSYFEGLVRNIRERKSFKDTQNENSRRKSLVSQSSNRLIQNRGQKVLSYRTNSFKKIIPWQATTKQKQIDSSFFKNTISSTKKNLMKPNDLLISK